MASALKFDAVLFAETATDFARDNADTLYSTLLAPGEEGQANSPIRPLGEYVRPILSRDEVLLTEFIIGDVLQPDKRAGFTPLDDRLEFKPRSQKVKPGKINLRFKETEIVAWQKTWYGMQQGKKGKVDPTSLVVFEEYIFNKVLEKAKSSLRNQTMWVGDYDPNTANAISICDGLRTILDALIVDTLIPSGNIALINAITASNAVTEIKKISATLSAENMFRSDLVCLISPAHYSAYSQHYQSSRGAIPYNSQYNQGTIEGTLIPFFVEPGMNGYSPIITPRENIAWIYDEDFSDFAPTVDYNRRTEDLAFILKFQFAVDFINYKEIWTAEV